MTDFAVCAKCRTRAAQGEYAGRGRPWQHPTLCRGCEFVTTRDVEKAAKDQTVDALAAVRRADANVEWPYITVHNVAGPLPLGAVAYIQADTGVGKTTLVLDMIRRWVTGQWSRRGETAERPPMGVTVMPLETSPEEFRIALATTLVGVPHGRYYALKAAWDAEGDPEAKETLDRIDAMVKYIGTDPLWVKHFDVMVPDVVTVADLDRAFASARHHGHKAVVVDHIDQVGDEFDLEAGRKLVGMDAVRRVNDAVLEFARYYQVAAICMSQCNNSIRGDSDNPLARFRPPELHHLMYHPYKKKNAAQVLGIYRPMKTGLTREEFVLAREGTIDPLEVLEPNTTGLVMAKLRHRGENEGRKIPLRYVAGALRDLTAQEAAEDVLKKAGSSALTHTSFVGRDATRKPTTFTYQPGGAIGRDLQTKD
jgi:hypothetical protein